MSPFTIGLPSKGRLMEDALDVFAKAGLAIEKAGDRGYRGAIRNLENAEVEFLSASEIARHLQSGRLHLGVTGEDLIREIIPDADEKVRIVAPLGFGHADVVVAVPAWWIDVETMADLDAAAALFATHHGRYMRVATKYPLLTRRFFSATGLARYRTVESLGATEGAPAAGTAEAIVDITSTGSTLRGNGLKVLADGVILRSQACLIASRTAHPHPYAESVCDAVATMFNQSNLKLSNQTH